MLAYADPRMSTFYPDAKKIKDPTVRTSPSIRLIAKMPTLAAFAFATRWGSCTSIRTTT